MITSPVGIRGKLLGAVAPNPLLAEEWHRTLGVARQDEIVSVSVDGVPVFYPRHLVFAVVSRVRTNQLASAPPRYPPCCYCFLLGISCPVCLMRCCCC